MSVHIIRQVGLMVKKTVLEAENKCTKFTTPYCQLKSQVLSEALQYSAESMATSKISAMHHKIKT